MPAVAQAALRHPAQTRFPTKCALRSPHALAAELLLTADLHHPSCLSSTPISAQEREQRPQTSPACTQSGSLSSGLMPCIEDFARLLLHIACTSPTSRWCAASSCGARREQEARRRPGAARERASAAPLLPLPAALHMVRGVLRRRRARRRRARRPAARPRGAGAGACAPAARAAPAGAASARAAHERNSASAPHEQRLSTA